MIRFRTVGHLLVRFTDIVMGEYAKLTLMHVVVVTNQDIKQQHVQLASTNSQYCQHLNRDLHFQLLHNNNNREANRAKHKDKEVEVNTS